MDSLAEYSNAYITDVRRNYKNDHRQFQFEHDRINNSPYCIIHNKNSKVPQIEIIREGLSVDPGF